MPCHWGKATRYPGNLDIQISPFPVGSHWSNHLSFPLAMLYSIFRCSLANWESWVIPRLMKIRKEPLGKSVLWGMCVEQSIELHIQCGLKAETVHIYVHIQYRSHQETKSPFILYEEGINQNVHRALVPGITSFLYFLYFLIFSKNFLSRTGGVFCCCLFYQSGYTIKVTWKKREWVI